MDNHILDDYENLRPDIKKVLTKIDIILALVKKMMNEVKEEGQTNE